MRENGKTEVPIVQQMAAWKGIESDGELEAAVQRAATGLGVEEDGEGGRRRGAGGGDLHDGGVSAVDMVELAKAGEHTRADLGVARIYNYLNIFDLLSSK